MTELIEFVGVLLSFVPVVATVAPLIAFIVDTAKRFGLPDGYAPLASGVLNLIAYTVFYFTSPPEGDVANIVGAVLVIAPYLVALVLSLLGSAYAHRALEQIGIGYSHSRG